MENLKKGILITLVLFLITTIYTYMINGFAQVFFHESANGSIILKNGEGIGSKYIGQNFESDKYFHGRASIFNYNTYSTLKEAQMIPSSGGSNLGGSNLEYNKNIKERIEKILSKNPSIEIKDIPVDMVTASASGLDPHITTQGALIQVERVAKVNGITKEEVINLVKKMEKNGIINVLELNLALENLIK